MSDAKLSREQTERLDAITEALHALLSSGEPSLVAVEGHPDDARPTDDSSGLTA